MSVSSIKIILPVRAAWWLQRVAVQQGVDATKLIERWVLERLNATPGVDLSRTPGQED